VEGIVSYFKVFSRHSSGGIEEKGEKSQDNQCPDRDLNQTPPEYVRMPPLEPTFYN
jgi:hypothetical protein